MNENKIKNDATMDESPWSPWFRAVGEGRHTNLEGATHFKGNVSKMRHCGCTVSDNKRSSIFVSTQKIPRFQL